MTEPTRFLLDSNICIAFLAAGGEGLRARMRLHRDQLVTSSICFGEVMLGFERAGAEAGLSAARALFGFVTVLPYDKAAADQYSRLPFQRGRLDRLIAAQCLSLGAVLVTANVADFSDIPSLRVENWLV